MQRPRRLITATATAAVAAASLVGATSAMAAHTNDPTFGVGGAATGVPWITQAQQSNPQVVATLPDGRMVLAGITGGSSGQYSYVERRTSNGMPDTTFAHKGWARIDTDAADVKGIAVDRLGRVSVLVDHGTSASVTRFTASGALDYSFGTVTSYVGGAPVAQIAVDQHTGTAPVALPAVSSLTATPDGRLLIGGRTSTDAGIEMLTPAGAPDTAFGVAGVAMAHSSTTVWDGGAITVLPDGTLRQVTDVPGPPATVMVRAYTASGRRLPSADAWVGSLESASAIATDLAGHVVVGGTGDCTSPTGIWSAAPSFAVVGTGTQGIACDTVTPGNSFEEFTAMTVQGDGTVDLLGDYAPVYKGFTPRVWQFHADGSLDTTFGTKGHVAEPIDRESMLSWAVSVGAITTDSAGRLVGTNNSVVFRILPH